MWGTVQMQDSYLMENKIQVAQNHVVVQTSQVHTWTQRSTIEIKTVSVFYTSNYYIIWCNTYLMTLAKKAKFEFIFSQNKSFLSIV